ncbi:septum site-determining protein [Gordoniibacillus kamchatkensis]|uniref:2-aminoethylphosphonate--pyruvate transaminase n=1 Tax=Gordoniibacillus kamchatkensis TaxID=1590651 RepID=A0ABR5AIL1_9BACL|nr:2-aminoethylphosphonate--pyruvate transaminase [Paenibacillus sp. VKM B-2647]KIL40197.1 septum site-determining protein [Paenibacillus sp. VKM B-2647]
MPPVRRNILLNPGPATTTDSVKYAQVVPDICPREKEFGQLMEYVAAELTRLVADTDRYAAVLFSGSGTAAVESIISSAVGDDEVVIINNGAYGKRMCDIARTYGIKFREFKSSPYEAVNLSDLEQFIRTSSDSISHLAVVHHETTTGLLNDIEAIGQLCSKYRIIMIVDAMSSFAAVPISMKSMHIGYLAASSNKNLQGMAGISFCIANKELLEDLRQVKPRSYYLNLYDQYDYFSSNGQMRFTPPVQTIYALKQAIEELRREGVAQRYERYCKSWETLIGGLNIFGLKHLVKESDHSKLLTTIVEPDCELYDFNEMHDFFYERGFTIYPGKLGELKTFRIANIGDITSKDIEAFLELLRDYLVSINFLKKGE